MTRCRRRPGRLAFLLAAALVPPSGVAAGAASAPAPAIAAVVEQPRPFGHVVGDVLSQRVLLDAGAATAPASLVAPQRLGAWIERRAARVERTADGRRWLVVDYQVVNAPRSRATVSLPAWRLAADAAAPERLVPAWPIEVSAIAAQATPGTDAWRLRPDRPAPAIATAPLRRRVLLASAGLVACLVAWAGWLALRRWHDDRTQPFASALRALARDGQRQANDWRALHEAFDRTAGQVLLASTLPRLFERAPQFEPLRHRIEAFYAQSAARFFGDAPPSSDQASPFALCRDLRRIERRSQR